MNLNWFLLSALTSTLFLSAEPHKRFDSNQHFETFSHITFEKNLEGRAKEVAVEQMTSKAVAIGIQETVQIADASDEVKTVNVKGAKVHSKPVTNEEYAKFVKATGRTPPEHWKNGTYPTGEGKKPVTNVSFHDAKEYAKWANKRLPSFDEWMSASDQLDWDLEMPKNEWTSSISGSNVDGTRQVILNQGNSLSTMPELYHDLNTGFRVAVPSDVLTPLPKNEFEMPGGGELNPDQSIEGPGGEVIEPSRNPYDYGK